MKGFFITNIRYKAISNDIKFIDFSYVELIIRAKTINLAQLMLDIKAKYIKHVAKNTQTNKR